MSQIFIPLESVRVASPCHADWDAMDGNDRVKFCGSCRKNVYNLSEMTRFDAEELIAEKEGNLCVRYYQRADGTVMTQDCPIGLAKARRAALMPLRWVGMGAAALVAWGILLLTGGKGTEAGAASASVPPFSLQRVPLYMAVMDRLSPPPPMVAGGIAMAPPPKTTMGTPPPMMGNAVSGIVPSSVNPSKSHGAAKTTKKQVVHRKYKRHTKSHR